jgi:hypothetical protein
MVDDRGANGSDEDPSYIDDIDGDELTGETQFSPTPEQHEQLKNGLHDDELFDRLRRADRRYLVIGQGGEDGPGARRQTVCELLDDRDGATAVRLEDFGFTSDELALWAPAFDILSEMASHIVGVIEDFDGGHVWELGFLYHQQTHIRDVLWLLKRLYESDAEMRDRYDNGMAASHLAALEAAAGDRVITWDDPADLPDAVASIP